MSPEMSSEFVGLGPLTRAPKGRCSKGTSKRGLEACRRWKKIQRIGMMMQGSRRLVDIN